MLRRACSLCSRVLAWRSLLLLLCISHVAPWGLVGAAVIQQQPAGGAPLARDNVFNGNNNNNNNNFNMNQKISNNANPVIFNNNNNQNSNNNDNLQANNLQANQPFPAMGFNNGNNVAANTNNNNKKAKFPAADSPVGNAGAGSERLWPAVEKKTFEWQGNAAAQAAPVGNGAAVGGTGPRLVANPPPPPGEKVNLGLGPPPLPAVGAGAPAAAEGLIWTHDTDMTETAVHSVLESIGFNQTADETYQIESTWRCVSFNDKRIISTDEHGSWKVSIDGKDVNTDVYGIPNAISSNTVRGVLAVGQAVKTMILCEGVADAAPSRSLFTDQIMNHGEVKTVVRSKNCCRIVPITSLSGSCQECLKGVKNQKKSMARKNKSCGQPAVSSPCKVDMDTHTQSSSTAAAQPEPSIHNLPDKMYSFWKEQVQNISRAPNGRRWTKEVLCKCIELYSKAPTPYENLASSGLMILPSAKTLQRYKNLVHQRPGINRDQLGWMQQLADENRISPEGRVGGLIFDEMAIQPDLQFDNRGGQEHWTGFATLGKEADLIEHVIEGGMNGFQRAADGDTLPLRKNPQQGSDTLFYQRASDNINQGRTGMRRNDDNPIDDKWERETEKLVYRPKIQDEGSEPKGTKSTMRRQRGTPPVPGRYAVAQRPRVSTDGKLFHPTVAYTLFNASYVKNDENRFGQEQAQDSNRGNGLQERAPTWRRRRKIRKPGVTAPPSKPKMDMKQHVSWFEGSRMYAFRASPDTRLLIRHAPIPAAGSPWPLPQHYYPEDAVFSLRPEHFQFHAIGETCDVLDFQFDRIRRNTFGDDWEKVVEEAAAGGGGGWGGEQEDHKYKEIRYINVTVLKECPKYPHLNDDESYDLEVKKSGASIIAREVWGAVRALETFSQLIYQDEEGRYLINRTLINDFPRFPHRGILLDTARHYLNKETVINNLEAMAQNKMNVFHWHITDDQSFPFESKTFPNITKNGAYDSRTHIYTHEVIAEIIEEARLRGIRVIPEFDTPGHTLSWGFGQDYLLTPCYDYSRQPNGLFGPINPILKTTYQFLQKFFREVLAVFKDKYIHLGGDEVPFDCWESNPQIRNFITRNNLSDIRDVLGLYERKLLEIVTQLGKGREKGSGYIVWQEVVDNGVNVKPDTIVQVWMGDAFDVERMINMGLRVIYSTCWYLDYINYGQDWDKYYRCEQLDQLQDFQLKNSSLLLGGEAALWTEYADDENVISRLWPRASAAAERLWSNKRVRDEVAAASRIEEQRCRMLRRGLKVGVLSGPGHCPVWSHRGKQQQKKEPPIFSWSSHNDEMQFKSNYPQVYVVDMNAMYLVPVLIVICICCLTLITLAQDSKSKIVAILSYPVAGSSKKGVKGLLYVFMAFAFAWCIWTAPIWMNSWETGANKARPVQPTN